MIFIIVLLNFVRRDYIFSFLKLIAKFDKETMDMKFKVNHSKKRWFIFAFLGFNFTVFIFIYFLTMLYEDPTKYKLMYTILLFYFTQTYIMSVYQFIFGAYSIVSRFHILNQNAR